MAQLFELRGSKRVTLEKRLGIGRESLRRSLKALVELGLVSRNPGYGHPMRPEYILTDAGLAIGESSHAIVACARGLSVEALAYQKWSLPVLDSLGCGITRFGGIQKRLPSVTSRALSLSLKGLHRETLTSRTVADGYPPVSSYALAPRGRELAQLTAELRRSLTIDQER